MAYDIVVILTMDPRELRKVFASRLLDSKHLNPYKILCEQESREPILTESIAVIADPTMGCTDRVLVWLIVSN